LARNVINANNKHRAIHTVTLNEHIAKDAILVFVFNNFDAKLTCAMKSFFAMFKTLRWLMIIVF